MGMLNWFKEFICPSNAEEKDSLLKHILDDIIENDKEAYYTFDKSYNWCVFICSHAHKDILKAEMLSKSKIRRYKFYDKFQNRDVTIFNASVDDVAIKRFDDGNFFCTFFLRFSKGWTEYHHVSKSSLVKAFADGYPIHPNDYERYKTDFEGYGFTLSYKDAQLILHHPKGE